MRILIDTNLFIPLEKPAPELDAGIASLVRLAAENGHQILLHPASVEDIERDEDVERKAINLAKVAKYPQLGSPPAPTTKELVALGLTDTNDNSRVDNRILFAIYRDAADLLVTEDEQIHKKARRLGLSTRVYYTQQAAEALFRLHARTPVALPNIEEVYLHSIDVSIAFFDSLRKGYDGFDDWFKTASRKGRKAWIHRAADGALGAICIYKEERDSIVTSGGKKLPGRVLKLCTFKVGESVRGRKVGELLLKAAFRYASYNKMEYIYLTMKSDQSYLQSLCEDFGFQNYGDIDNDEAFVKAHPAMPPTDSQLAPLEYHIRYFPNFRAASVKKFLVPIRPGYHEVLFSDHPENQQQLNLFTAGNAIKLAYLCHSPLRGIEPGDILLFYRSEDTKGITSVGIVEFASDLRDLDRILQLVSKRTVYPIAEIEKMSRKPTKVLLFRLACHIATPISRDEMASSGKIRGNIQSIRGVSNEFFDWFRAQAKLDNCLPAN